VLELYPILCLQCKHTTNRFPDSGANKEKESNMLKVTFYVYSKVLNKEFLNIELHRSMDDARLRACALNWTISKVEEA
jgi:hypothetical protein